ncbi:restriction endonuclease subunit S [Streptomyces mirabilis]|uniref:restriction endonuclease subunit S n=1 Tax=Streptomyces mirabilis TaxID=68239 RepID=UPI0035DB1C2C
MTKATAPLKTFAEDAQTGPFGSQLHSEEYIEGGIPVINPSNIKDGRLIADRFSTVSTETAHRLRVHRLRAGDLVFARRGEVGRAAVVSKGEEGWLCGTGAIRVRANHEQLDPHFAGYALQSAEIRSYFTQQAVGSTMGNLNTSIVLGTPIPGIPLEEQRRIADFLDTETARIDALTNARDSQLRCLERLWVARLASKADELIATYGLLPLRRVVSSVEQGWSPQCDDAEAGPAEWAVLKTSAVSSGLFKPLEHKRLPSDLEPDLRYQIMDGDILMTRGSGSPAHVGVATVAEIDGRQLLLSDLLYRVRLDHGWSPEYVTLMLGSAPVRGFMSLLFRGQSGQTIKLRSEDIKSIDIPAAPITAQAALARELASARLSIREAQAAIRSSSALLAERRQALITAAVTGQFDVSTASGRNVTDGVTA